MLVGSTRAHPQCQVPRTRAAPVRLDGTMDRRLARVIQRLSLNYRKKPRISVLAEEIGISERRLEQICKAQNGATLTSLYRRSRNQRARKLLDETFWSVQDISRALGYRTVDAFCKEFKRMNGCT